MLISATLGYWKTFPPLSCHNRRSAKTVNLTLALVLTLSLCARCCCSLALLVVAEAKSYKEAEGLFSRHRGLPGNRSSTLPLKIGGLRHTRVERQEGHGGRTRSSTPGHCVGCFSAFHCGQGTITVGNERQPLLRDFDSPWVVRIVLICFSMLWTLGEIFRLPWLREGDRVLHGLGLNSQANLCRFHVVWSVGLMEPGLLLTVLFLVRGSLQAAPRHLNGKILMLMVLSCLPVFILQLIVAVTSHSNYHEGFGGSLPSYFTRSYDVLLDDTNSRLALCNYPLFSILALGLFSLIFVFYFARQGYRLLRHVINRKLRLRVYWLVLAMILLLPLHVTFLGVSVWLDANKTAHEVLMFLGFCTLLLCVIAAIGVLVVLPVADAIAVHYFFQNRDQSWQSFSASPVELFGRPLSAVVSDDEDSPHNVARWSLLGAVSSIATDAGSSSRDGSLTFDIIPKDLTLGPGGWLVDVPGSVTSPPSPALPRKPLTVL